MGVEFLTVVLDLDSGAIAFVGRGNGAVALDTFWKRMAGSKARIEEVAADMSPTDALAVRRHLPQAVRERLLSRVVVDRGRKSTSDQFCRGERRQRSPRFFRHHQSDDRHGGGPRTFVSDAGRSRRPVGRRVIGATSQPDQVKNAAGALDPRID